MKNDGSCSYKMDAWLGEKIHYAAIVYLTCKFAIVLVNEPEIHGQKFNTS